VSAILAELGNKTVIQPSDATAFLTFRTVLCSLLGDLYNFVKGVHIYLGYYCCAQRPELCFCSFIPGTFLFNKKS